MVGKLLYISENLRETKKIAKYLVSQLKGGDLVALFGDLGAGKTTFVKMVANYLGIKQNVSSPTFVIMKVYDTHLKKIKIKRFYHLDLYRITDENSIKSLGITEIIQNSENIIAIEWPEHMGSLLPKNRWNISFKMLSETKREIVIEKI